MKPKDPTMSKGDSALPRSLTVVTPRRRAIQSVKSGSACSWGVLNWGHLSKEITQSSPLFYHCSVCSSKQVAAAYFLCPWTRRQDLWLHTMSTEVFLPNRAAGNVPTRRTGIEVSCSYRRQRHFKSGFTVSLPWVTMMLCVDWGKGKIRGWINRHQSNFASSCCQS